MFGPSRFVFFFILLNIQLIITYGDVNTVHKRFEYKYSFKPPYLAQADSTVPFWEFGGSKYIFASFFYYDTSDENSTIIGKTGNNFILQLIIQ